MSRIGKQPVLLPAGVKVSKSGATVTVEGPKGKSSYAFHPDMKITVDDKAKAVRVERPADAEKPDQPSNAKKHRALHGLTRALLQNMVRGVVDPYEKKLEITGVGYQAKMFYADDVLDAVGLPTSWNDAPTATTGGNVAAFPLGQIAARLRAGMPYRTMTST